MARYGTPEGRMSIQGFLDVIYDETGYTSYKPILFDVRDYHKER
jgi:hypothetical protein